VGDHHVDTFVVVAGASYAYVGNGILRRER